MGDSERAGEEQKVIEEAGIDAICCAPTYPDVKVC
jgi:hypothetical protein